MKLIISSPFSILENHSKHKRFLALDKERGPLSPCIIIEPLVSFFTLAPSHSHTAIQPKIFEGYTIFADTLTVSRLILVVLRIQPS